MNHDWSAEGEQSVLDLAWTYWKFAVSQQSISSNGVTARHPYPYCFRDVYGSSRARYSLLR